MNGGSSLQNPKLRGNKVVNTLIFPLTSLFFTFTNKNYIHTMNYVILVMHLPVGTLFLHSEPNWLVQNGAYHQEL